MCHVHICHAASQARLQHLGVPPEEPHDARPAHRGEDGPAVPPHSLQLLAAQAQQALSSVPSVRACDEAVVARRLHSQLRQRQADSCEDVDDDLLVHAALRRLAMAEDPVAAEETGEESMHALLFPSIDSSEGQHRRFVQERKFGQVRSVLPGGFEDESELLL